MAKKVTERVIEIDARGAENSIRALREEIRQLTAHQKELDIESEEFRDISTELTAAQTKLRNAVQGNTAAVEGSYKAYSHQLQVLKEHRKWLAEGTEEYRKATEEITRLDAKLKEMDAEVGVYGRNVGNYSSAFESLSDSMQQAAQNIPQLVRGGQNLFEVARSSMPQIIKSAEGIGETATQGGRAKAVIGALTKTLFSWKTALVGGIAILAEFGDEIVNWVAGLFDAKKEISGVEQAQRDLDEAMSDAYSGIGEEVIELRKLGDAWDELGDNMSAKEAFIRENQSALEELGVAITGVNDAEEFFAEHTDEYIEAMKQRAKASAATRLAAEKYEELIKLEEQEAQAEEQYRNTPEYITQSVYISSGVASTTEVYNAQGLRLAENAWEDASAAVAAAKEYIDSLYETSRELEASAANTIARIGGTDYDTLLGQWFGVSEEDIDKTRERLSEIAKVRRDAMEELRKDAEAQRISVTGAYKSPELAIPTLGGNAIDQSAEIDANKKRLEALKQMAGASAEERKAIEERLAEDLSFIELIRLESHEMLLNEMLRGDELSADERLTLEEQLTENLIAQAQLRADAAGKAAAEQAEAEKKAAEEVIDIEKKKQDIKEQMMQQASAILRNSADMFEEHTVAYKSLNAAAVVVDTITGAVAGWKAGMESAPYVGPIAATALAALNLTATLTMGAAQLKALLEVRPDGSNAGSALSSAQAPDIASSMPAAYTRNLMGDNELSELNKDTRVYVLEQDITDAQKASRARVESASF